MNSPDCSGEALLGTRADYQSPEWLFPGVIGHHSVCLGQPEDRRTAVLATTGRSSQLRLGSFFVAGIANATMSAPVQGLVRVDCAGFFPPGTGRLLRMQFASGWTAQRVAGDEYRQALQPTPCRRYRRR